MRTAPSLSPVELMSVKGRSPKHHSIRRRQSQRAPGIREQPRSKADKDRSGFLQRKFILKPISPSANPCSNPTLQIGVVSLGMGDATALQSKQQTG
jgi:hypothetical protein